MFHWKYWKRRNWSLFCQCQVFWTEPKKTQLCSLAMFHSQIFHPKFCLKMGTTPQTWCFIPCFLWLLIIFGKPEGPPSDLYSSRCCAWNGTDWWSCHLWCMPSPSDCYNWGWMNRKCHWDLHPKSTEIVATVKHNGIMAFWGEFISKLKVQVCEIWSLGQMGR